MLPALVVGTLLVVFGDRLGFGVNPPGLLAGSVAVATLVWVVWHGTTTRAVAWPGRSVDAGRRISADWATETLMANALRGSERSLRELSRMLDEAAGRRDDLSPGLRRFIDAGRAGHPMPAITRRHLHDFLKEIT